MNPFSPDFLRQDLINLLHNLEPATPAHWGKMNAQQMVEHLDDFIGLSIDRNPFPLSVPEEQLPKYREFLFGPKEFRENTKAPANVLGEDPQPVRHPDLYTAINSLHNTIKEFFRIYEEQPAKQALHPAFGELDFQGWLVLHGKHVRHHLRQFGLL